MKQIAHVTVLVAKCEGSAGFCLSSNLSAGLGRINDYSKLKIPQLETQPVKHCKPLVNPAKRIATINEMQIQHQDVKRGSLGDDKRISSGRDCDHFVALFLKVPGHRLARQWIVFHYQDNRWARRLFMFVVAIAAHGD